MCVCVCARACVCVRACVYTGSGEEFTSHVWQTVLIVGLRASFDGWHAQWLKNMTEIWRKIQVWPSATYEVRRILQSNCQCEFFPCIRIASCGPDVFYKMSVFSRPREGTFYRIRSLHPAKRKFHCRIKWQFKFLPFAGILCDKAPVACLAGSDKLDTVHISLAASSHPVPL